MSLSFFGHSSEIASPDDNELITTYGTALSAGLISEEEEQRLTSDLRNAMVVRDAHNMSPDIVANIQKGRHPEYTANHVGGISNFSLNAKATVTSEDVEKMGEQMRRDLLVLLKADVEGFLHQLMDDTHVLELHRQVKLWRADLEVLQDEMRKRFQYSAAAPVVADSLQLLEKRVQKLENRLEDREQEKEHLRKQPGDSLVVGEAKGVQVGLPADVPPDQKRQDEQYQAKFEDVVRGIEERMHDRASALDARLVNLEKSGLRQLDYQSSELDASPATQKDIAALDGKLANTASSAQLQSISPSSMDAAPRDSKCTASTTSSMPAFVERHDSMWYPECENVDFQETVWDAALFIGMQQVGLLGSVAILIMFPLNVFMQFMFMLIVFNYMSDFAFTPNVVIDLVRWRFDVGHSLDQVNMADEQSLVSRVCAHDAKLNVADRFAHKLDTIVTYLPRGTEDSYTLFGLEIGPIMCLMALMVWMLTCAKEFQRITQLLRLLVVVPKTKNMRSCFIRKDDLLVLSELSILRSVIFSVVLGVRIAAGVALLFAGMKYLCMTFSLSDLFLNAVALEMILNMDEAIFLGLAPVELHSFLTHIEPTPVAVHSCLGVGIQFPLFCAVTMALLVASFFSWIQPNRNGLNDAWDALCSGNVNFAYGIPKTTPFMAWSHTRCAPEFQEYFPPGKSLERFRPLSFRHQIIKDIVMTGETGTLALTGTIKSFKPVLSNVEGSLVNEVALPVKSAYELVNLQCEEIGHNLTEWELESIKDTLRDHSIGAACHEGGPWAMACWQDTLFGYIARTYCPRLCGCDKANSGQVLLDKGCPSTCFQRGSAIETVAHRKCADLNFSRLDGFFPEIEWLAEEERENWWVQVDHKSNWFELCNHFEAASRNMVESMQRTASEVSADLRSYGCAAVKRWTSLGTDLCQPVSPFAGAPSFRYYCPVACQCQDGGRSWDYCPASCKHGEDTTLDSLKPVVLCSSRSGNGVSSKYPCACGSSRNAKTRCLSESFWCHVKAGKDEGECFLPFCTKTNGIQQSEFYPCTCGIGRSALTKCNNSNFLCKRSGGEKEGTCNQYNIPGCQMQCTSWSNTWASKCSWGPCKNCPDCRACSTGPHAACNTCQPPSLRKALDHCKTCNDGYGLAGTLCRAFPTTGMAVGLTVVANPRNDHVGSLGEELANTIGKFKEELADVTRVNPKGIVIESVGYEVKFIYSFSTCVSLDSTRQSLARVYQVPVRDVFAEFTAHHLADSAGVDSAGVGVSVVVQASSEKVVGEIVEKAFDTSELSDPFARTCVVNVTPTVEEAPKVLLVAQTSVLSNSFARVETPNITVLEWIGKSLGATASIVVPLCTHRDGVKVSDHYPCICGSSSNAKTQCIASGFWCRVYGGDDEGQCVAIADWYLAETGDTCKSDCEKRGLACDAAEQHARNSDVDSSQKMMALIARLGSGVYAKTCSAKLDFSPEFAEWSCTFPKPGSAYDCGKTPSWGKQRLCWCSKPRPS